MVVEDILNEWKIDSIIDITELGEESLRIPKLHAKYILYLSNNKQTLYSLLRYRRSLKSQLFAFYAGHVNENDSALQRLHRGPSRIRVLKSEIPAAIESDILMLKLDKNIDELNNIIYTLEDILKSIHGLGWQIKNSIEWNKFMIGD